MDANEAEKFPLFKDYEFGLVRTSHGGMGTLLVPKNGVYRPKYYGMGELALAPYIQEPFNEGESITLKDLMVELEEENELTLGGKRLSGMDWFLEKVINKFAKHKIISVDRRMKDKYALTNHDILSKGENYDDTRVHDVTSYEGSSLFDSLSLDRGPSIPI